MEATQIEKDDIQNQWDEKRVAKNLRKRERRQNVRIEDPTKYQETVFEESQKRKDHREKQKLENPDYTKIESQKRKERREKQKSKYEDRKKQNIQYSKRQIFSQIYDDLFEKNKPFPTPVSKSEWEKLKNIELNFIFNERIFPDGITIQDIKDSQKENIIFLREHPFHQIGPSIIFFLKTMVHRPKENIQRKITKEEMDWVFSLNLSDYEKSPKKLSRNYSSENKKEKNRIYHDKILTDRKTHNLNIRFMKEDPNKVLSVDEIINNPFVSNFSQREQYKINLWKQDKNPSDLEKWKKQRQDYEKEVSELSIEYKEQFLKKLKK